MKRIAFLKIGSYSGTNEYIFKILAERFPGYAIDVIDVWQDLMDYCPLRGWLAVIRAFGVRVLWQNYDTAVLRSEYFFTRAKKAVARRLEGEPYAFSLQAAPFFDLSVKGIPHFILTDGTNMSVASQFVGAPEPVFLFMLRQIHQAVWGRAKTPWVENVRRKVAVSIQRKFVCDQAAMQRERSIYHNACAVFTMSQDVRASVIKDYGCPEDKVVCVYHGSHLPPSGERAAASYAKKNILFMGYEWERKGGPELVAAFNKVKEAHPTATLTIVGCRPDIDAEGCVVVGKIPLDQMPSYYQAASVFCMPLQLEAFGIVFLEALHYRLPIVSTRLGAIRDMVEEGANGYLVERGDREALSDRLVALLNDPMRCQRFGARGYQIACEKYTWEHTGMVIEEKIRSLVPAQGPCLPGPPPAIPRNFFFYWNGEGFCFAHYLSLRSLLRTNRIERCEVYYENEPIDNEAWELVKNTRGVRMVKVDYQELFLRARQKPADFDGFFDRTQQPNHRSDLFRYVVLACYGGVYLDFDMLVVKDLAPLLSCEFFMSFQQYEGLYPLNGAVLGAQKGCAGVRMCLDAVKQLSQAGQSFSWLAFGPQLLSNVFMRRGRAARGALRLMRGLSGRGRDRGAVWDLLTRCVKVPGIRYEIYPSSYFFPYPWTQWQEIFKDNRMPSGAYAIHWWHSKNQEHVREMDTDTIKSSRSLFARAVKAAVDEGQEEGERACIGW